MAISEKRLFCMCFDVCVYMVVEVVYVYLYMCVHIWKLKVDSKCLPLLLSPSVL